MRLRVHEPPEPESETAYETVIVATPDIAGRLVGKRLTARHFAASDATRTCDVVFGWGVGHELLDGFEHVGWEHGYGDVVGRPDAATLRTVAWWPRTALVMADVFTAAGDAIPYAPRSILRTQVERAQALGFEPLASSELEFTVFDDTLGDLRDKGFVNPRLRREDLHPELVETTGLEEALLGDIRASMEASGVLVESVKAEYSPSQWEIGLEPASPLEAADRHAIYKLGVREICRRHDASATFMAKWHEDRAGQSCHLHVSLGTAEGHNCFAAGEDRLLRQFVAGLQRHARDVFLLWAPYPNSYKRFLQGTFAPAALTWGADNRTAALRVTGDGEGRHLENRIPGADVNPYLAHAALLAAGLAGVEDGLEPDDGIGHANAYARADAPALPRSLSDAIDSFSSSEFNQRVFGPTAVAHITNSAGKELEASQLAVTDWDRKRLFDI